MTEGKTTYSASMIALAERGPETTVLLCEAIKSWADGPTPTRGQAQQALNERWSQVGPPVCGEPL